MHSLGSNILGLQSIPQDADDNVSHQRRPDPTMELATYSFVLYLPFRPRVYTVPDSFNHDLDFG